MPLKNNGRFARCSCINDLSATDESPVGTTFNRFRNHGTNGKISLAEIFIIK